MRELNKTVQDLKMEMEKKTQKETTLEMENLGKRARVTDASIPTKYKR